MPVYRYVLLMVLNFWRLELVQIVYKTSVATSEIAVRLG